MRARRACVDRERTWSIERYNGRGGWFISRKDTFLFNGIILALDTAGFMPTAVSCDIIPHSD
jgi:hypothetical protein